MKRLLYSLALLFYSIPFFAQTFNSGNSLNRVALVYYYQDENGFFHLKENVPLQEVFDIVTSYAYDKKSQELYVETHRGNCVVTLNKDLAKVYKKSKTIPQLKGNDLHVAIEKHNNSLASQFARMNEARQKHIEDSIAKAREDSIRRARLDSIQKAQTLAKAENYRKAHKWMWFPVNKASLSCSLCDMSVYSKDSLFCFAFRNDTLYHVTSEDLALGASYYKIHPIYVPTYLRNSDEFKYHCEVFADSLQLNRFSNIWEKTEEYNDVWLFNAMDALEGLAPYGYVDDWSWNNEFSVSFKCTFRNLNKKTIKYIDIYWKITNDVNDVRKTGVFKGTGPVEYLHAGTWDWDSSYYYVAGDASSMQITKIVLTYMDGTKKVLQGKSLLFN